MGFEELGLNHEDQLQIRARAVAGVLEDRRLLGKAGVKDPALRTEAEFRVQEGISKIMADLGVDEKEATLIYAERLIINTNEEQE